MAFHTLILGLMPLLIHPLSSLQEQRRWRTKDPLGWAAQVAGSLARGSERARLLRRLGQRDAARRLLPGALRSTDPTERIAAAREVAILDPPQSNSAIEVLAAILNARNADPDTLAEAALAMVHTNPAYGGRVAWSMHQLILRTSNNFVRIPAARVLLAADRREQPYVVRLLEPLLRDPNNGVRALAVRGLFEADHRYLRKALAVLPPLVSDPNTGVRDAAIVGLEAIGEQYPDVVLKAVQVPAEPPFGTVTHSTAWTLYAFVKASDEQSAQRAGEKLTDFFLNQRRDVLDVSRLVGAELAHWAHPPICPQDPHAQVKFLVEQMQTPTADRWAVYRHGCAYAVGLCVPASARPAARAYIGRLWNVETRPHVRIALAIAMERLSNQSWD